MIVEAVKEFYSNKHWNKGDIGEMPDHQAKERIKLGLVKEVSQKPKDRIKKKKK